MQYLAYSVRYSVVPINSSLLTVTLYYALLPLLKSQSVRRAEKVTIYKTLIRPVVTYGAEVWTLLNGWQFLNEKF
jgi:hypothetical protein